MITSMLGDFVVSDEPTPAPLLDHEGQAQRAARTARRSAGFIGILGQDFSGPRRELSRSASGRHGRLGRVARLLRENPPHQLLDFGIAQVGARPHDEALAPMARTATADDIGQSVARFRITAIVSGDRRKRRPDVGAAQCVALEATLLLSKLERPIEIVVRICQCQQRRDYRRGGVNNTLHESSPYWMHVCLTHQSAGTLLASVMTV